jgi:hypothetical protein
VFEWFEGWRRIWLNCCWKTAAQPKEIHKAYLRTHRLKSISGSACSEPPLIYSTRSFVWLLLFPTQKLEKALGDGIVIAISTSAHAFIQIVFVE